MSYPAVITSGYLKKQLPTSNVTTTRNNSLIPHRTIQAGACPITSCTSSLLSSIKIVVLDKGRIVEEGTHQELTALRGTYYKLVKNQLELGN